MKTFVFPGSFDPFSLGHLDIAKRATKLCDRLVVAVMNNSVKHPTFTSQERKMMAEKCLEGTPGIEVITHDSLLVDLFVKGDAAAGVRGLRSESDFRNEAEMAAANKLLLPEYDVILLPCSADLAFTSSTIIKEVAFYGGNISRMVSPSIVDFVATTISERIKRD